MAEMRISLDEKTGQISGGVGYQVKIVIEKYVEVAREHHTLRDTLPDGFWGNINGTIVKFDADADPAVLYTDYCRDAGICLKSYQPQDRENDTALLAAAKRVTDCYDTGKRGALGYAIIDLRDAIKRSETGDKIL